MTNDCCSTIDGTNSTSSGCVHCDRSDLIKMKNNKNGLVGIALLLRTTDYFFYRTRIKIRESNYTVVAAAVFRLAGAGASVASVTVSDGGL